MCRLQGRTEAWERVLVTDTLGKRLGRPGEGAVVRTRLILKDPGQPRVRLFFRQDQVS